MDSPSSDFEELLACLNAHQVKAVIVGSYALAFHGRPRFTKAPDLFIEPTATNAERLLVALEAFGFGSVGLTVDDFTKPGHVIQLGYSPNRIDLLASIAGLTFDADHLRHFELRSSNFEV